jgi:hypothetical protein
MGARKLIFPIALAILWVIMAAMAMVDFASFDATTRPSRPSISMQKPLRTSAVEGREVRLVRG